MKTDTRKLLAGLGLMAALSGNAFAQAGTGSLTNWSVFGDAVSQGGAITLTTARLDGGEDQASNLSTHAAVDISVLESAAGVAPYGLDLSPDDYGFEGSLVGQSFAAAAGDTLSFDWSFSTLEAFFEDRAFVVINGEVITLATLSAPGAASQTFSYTVGATNTLSLSFGVIDTVDYLGVSSLSISNLQLTPATAPIPEPGTYALLLGGLGVLGFVARRRRDAARQQPR